MTIGTRVAVAKGHRHALGTVRRIMVGHALVSMDDDNAHPGGETILFDLSKHSVIAVSA